MEENQKMNVVVLGISGAGKSTLIKSISGNEIVTGIGEGQTQRVDVYESSTWPIRCIDTKGFEYSLLEQWKTIRQVKKYSKKQFNDTGIDVVWYCIEGTSGRAFSHNIELMNKAIKNWKNIPVFAIITKSYSEKDIPKNIKAVEESFSKSKGINLKGILPIIAEEYIINDETTIAPYGIEELCLKTIDCLEEAKVINKSNRDRMVLGQKRFTANALVASASASAGVIGAVPIVNFSDSVLLTPLEIGMVKKIFKIYGVETSKDLIVSLVGSTMITNIAKSIVKLVPLAGTVANSVVATAIVYALGEAVILASEGVYKGTIDPTKIEEFTSFITNKVKDNVVIKATTSYFEKNMDKLKDKNPKEIFKEIMNSVQVKSK